MSIIRKAGLSTLAGAVGAAVAYLFDPDRGRTRRAKARDQMLARARRAGRELNRRARYSAGAATGPVKQAASSAGADKPTLNDVALARKVESVIFRPEDAPKGRVSVNAEDGVIFLRGEVETQEQIDMLVRGAEHVDGVREVRNLMHLPGTPAPSKDDPLSRLEQETISRG
jgi:osmotically-inducible protein OsmY